MPRGKRQKKSREPKQPVEEVVEPKEPKKNVPETGAGQERYFKQHPGRKEGF